MTSEQYTMPTQERIAVHEAGHGLVAWLLPSIVCVREISLVPRVINDRSAAGWVDVRFNPFRIEDSQLDAVAYCLGGCAAEIVIFGSMSSLHSRNDLLQAKEAATHFVESLRPKDRKFQLGIPRCVTGIDIIAMFRAEIDPLVSEVLRASYIRAKDLIHTHRHQHTLLYKNLLQRQSLSADDIDAILGKRP